jgi:single-stranded-DNA-specific exonuclease
VPPRTAWALAQAGVHPLLARLFAARGIRAIEELDDALTHLLPPAGLLGADDAATLLADAIGAGGRICVVADYDCDGATACAVLLRGLAMLGAERSTLSYVVPDRRVHGYGLTPAIVDLALGHAPDVLVTVDNGIASLEGVAHARAAGLAVVITDHHLPARLEERVVLPAADVIVNPNQPDCSFASKHLAGVGVAFYLLLALRAELRAQGAFSVADQPRLDALLDLVALGTVADVVRLDRNNRCWCAQGLKRIRAAACSAGLAALFEVAGSRSAPGQRRRLRLLDRPAPERGRPPRRHDAGIECLLSDDPTRAGELARLLDAMNVERRSLEAACATRPRRRSIAPSPLRQRSMRPSRCSTRASTKASSASSLAPEGSPAPAGVRLRAGQDGR